MKCDEVASAAMDMSNDLDLFLKWLAVIIPKVNSDAPPSTPVDMSLLNTKRLAKILLSSDQVSTGNLHRVNQNKV
jgi:hypothetical protein